MESKLSVKHCAQCGTQIPPSFLNCPSCQKLVYTEELKKLSEEAVKASGEKRLSDAMAAWRQALELLPLESRQYQIILEKVAALGKEVDQESPGKGTGTAPGVIQEHKSFFGKYGNKAGLVGLAVVLFSKLKFLFLGFTKLHTLLTMLVALGAYWALWGWKFALGFVLSIYIHEMGHVEALGRYGIKASAPMFIPGIGAFVRLKQNLVNPREDARVGLAGPLWGLGAAVTSFILFRATELSVFAAIAQTGAWINLFNLMPVWQLDGGRGFQSLTSWQRWIAAFVIGVMAYYTREGLLLLLLILSLFQALKKDAPKEPDHVGLVQYVFLIMILSVMTTIPVAKTR